MFAFRVKGAEIQTGRDVVLSVYAASRNDLLDQVSRMGIVVASIEPLNTEAATRIATPAPQGPASPPLPPAHEPSRALVGKAHWGEGRGIAQTSLYLACLALASGAAAVVAAAQPHAMIIGVVQWVGAATGFGFAGWVLAAIAQHVSKGKAGRTAYMVNRAVCATFPLACLAIVAVAILIAFLRDSKH